MPKPTCLIGGCERKHLARGFCSLHYRRWMQHGTTELPQKPPKNTGDCPVSDCDREQEIGGMCTKHYQRLRLTGTTDDPKPREPRYCAFEGCQRIYYGNGYCHSHWKQLNRGEELSVLYGGMSPLEDRLAVSINKTDTCWLWTRPLNDDGYATIVVDGVFWFAHRYMYTEHVGPIPGGMELDHRCRVRHCVNPLHLRFATRKQNNEHRAGAQVNSGTGVRGVTRRPSGRYSAEVTHNKVLHYLGTFDTIEEADQAARAKRAELFTHDDAIY